MTPRRTKLHDRIARMPRYTWVSFGSLNHVKFREISRRTRTNMALLNVPNSALTWTKFVDPGPGLEKRLGPGYPYKKYM